MPFGCINTKTGEFQEGYIDKNGEMKYKNQKWYKRIFNKRNPIKDNSLYKEEYLGIKRLVKTNPDYPTRTIDVVVYKVINLITEEIVEIYAQHSTEIINFNVDAFVKENKLIVK